jgi:localization factor PodJL
VPVAPAAPAIAVPALPSSEPLPAAIGGKTLIAAATAGDPAAAFEVANRLADGRGVPQNFSQAAVWYERAAKGGLAPALFRLGALYEKGNGVAKDLHEARRLYVAAAQKGNSNAMHNLGVLHAEGIDGKPDFKEAAQWFRKSATYGISDSQYNLAVLYARGIGVERDLSEAYRWFALAAKGGDQEAGKKRDEIGTKLDPQVLAAMRRAAETWVADRPPEDALAVSPPANGWDQAEPATKIKPRSRAQSRSTAVPL